MLDALMSPILIGSLKVRNRVVMPPMATLFASESGGATQQHIHYHVERAKAGVGLQFVENVMFQAQTPPYRLKLHNNGMLPGFNELAEAIKQWGARVGMQVNHPGLLGQSPDINGLNPDQIFAFIEDFANCALRGKMAGFDIVEIHGAHAYLIAQFLSARTNHRTDEWGGTMEKRAKFAVEVIRCTRQKVGPDFPLAFRISGDEFIEGGRTIEETERIVPLLEEAGVNLLDVSGGGPFTREWTGLPMAYPRGSLAYLAERLKKHVRIPVVTVGRINDPRFADQLIREGKADLVAFGRALLADPQLIRKAVQGKFDEMRKCTACMDCRRRVVDLGVKMRCAVNADLGREGEAALLPARKIKKVMIIGGGPAGMEAARIAKMRGHRVTLYERERRLGGQLHYAIAPPHKEELNNILEYLTYQMKLQKIPVKLGVKVDGRLIQKARPDVVILAAGSDPALPSFEGSAQVKIWTSHEILGKKLPPGESFLIVGGGSVGCELAEHLAEKGKKVIIVELLEQMASDAESNVRKLLIDRLAHKIVVLCLRSRVQKIEGNRAWVVNEKDEVSDWPADVVVSAVGAVPHEVSIKGIEKMKPAPEIYTIGDCGQPGKIFDAIHDGNRIGRIV